MVGDCVAIVRVIAVAVLVSFEDKLRFCRGAGAFLV